MQHIFCRVFAGESLNECFTADLLQYSKLISCDALNVDSSCMLCKIKKFLQGPMYDQEVKLKLYTSDSRIAAAITHSFSSGVSVVCPAHHWIWVVRRSIYMWFSTYRNGWFDPLKPDIIDERFIVPALLYRCRSTGSEIDGVFFRHPDAQYRSNGLVVRRHNITRRQNTPRFLPSDFYDGFHRIHFKVVTGIQRLCKNTAVDVVSSLSTLKCQDFLPVRIVHVSRKLYWWSIFYRNSRGHS